MNKVAKQYNMNFLFEEMACWYFKMKFEAAEVLAAELYTVVSILSSISPCSETKDASWWNILLISLIVVSILSTICPELELVALLLVCITLTPVDWIGISTAWRSSFWNGWVSSPMRFLCLNAYHL